jgi:aconitate hydratase
MTDSFNARSTLEVDGREYEIFRLDSLAGDYDLARLPYSLKILLENLLRNEDGVNVTPDDISALAAWDPQAEPGTEIAFTPARVILQDFTGVPAIVDLAAMRDAVDGLGGDPGRINPLAPAELVIDHSVQVDVFGKADARDLNTRLEFQRNNERYGFLRWGQRAFDNFKVVPPGTGIVHQVNLEYLARVVFERERDGRVQAYPDTLVGTDSHTTMINGLGVLGWGVGGIEAEAAMLGQPVTMLIPQVVGFRLDGRLPEGATATDLVLTVTQMLRARGVVGKFVEFFGDGLADLPLADRATIANMAPEYGATCGIFPVDDETLRYLELTGRPPQQIALVEAYAREQGMFRIDGAPHAAYSDQLELDLGSVEPSLAGPKRPQDRIALSSAKPIIVKAMHALQEERSGRTSRNRDLARFADEGGGTAVAAEEAHHTGVETVEYADQLFELRDGAVVIAAITSCTNTSNPAVMVAAGLLASKARERGLSVKPWVKTSLAPGSKVVSDYLAQAGLLDDLEALGFHVVGFGCTTCIGNSGPLPEPISDAIQKGDLIACSILSGNRNFEGRIHPDVRMNFLASPPLVVAYALAGTMDLDAYREPLAHDPLGNPVYLRDIWPTQDEVSRVIAGNIDPNMFRRSYETVFAGDDTWQSMKVPEGEQYRWDEASTYIRHPPYFEGMSRKPEGLTPIKGGRVLCLLGDSVTTDHISPAGAIMPDSPAGEYLVSHGVSPGDFNSYGSRRGNHEVMMRGTFANIRLRNQLAPGTEGGWTAHLPGNEQMTIFDAAERYRDEQVPLLVIAGKEYGSGSSRDWAAKGPMLLGVKAVIAESYERIHRSNLIGMGILPLQFNDGESAKALGLSGSERYDIEDLQQGARQVTVVATPDAGDARRFTARVRIDTPKEWEYYLNGGILHYVIRQLAVQ